MRFLHSCKQWHTERMKFDGENSFFKRTAQGAAFVAASMAPVAEAQAESYENINKGSEEFAVEVSVEKTFVEMPNGVLFISSEGAPVAIMRASVISGVNPGKGFSETGHVTEGYAKSWKEEARNLADQSVSDIAQARYNWRDIQSALNNKNEQINTGEINSIMDIVYYFGDKEVRDGGGLSRIEYLTKHIVFDDEIPDTIQTELRFLVLGIAGEESRYRSDIKSSVNAGGVFQIMPKTAEGMGYKEYVVYENGVPTDMHPMPYTTQVEMVGKHFGNIYRELTAHLADTDLQEIQQLFSSEEEYQKFFYTPCMINAYNTGADRMAKAIKEFVTPEMLVSLKDKYAEGARYDLYDDLTEFAAMSQKGALEGYQEASSTYTRKVFAYAKSINEGYESHKQQQNTFSVANNQ